MKLALLSLLLCLAVPTPTLGDSLAPTETPQSAAPIVDPTDNIPRYPCSIECGAGSCVRWCSFQQRCQAWCTPQGMAACYCTL